MERALSIFDNTPPELAEPGAQSAWALGTLEGRCLLFVVHTGPASGRLVQKLFQLDASGDAWTRMASVTQELTEPWTDEIMAEFYVSMTGVGQGIDVRWASSSRAGRVTFSRASEAVSEPHVPLRLRGALVGPLVQCAGREFGLVDAGAGPKICQFDRATWPEGTEIPGPEGRSSERGYRHAQLCGHGSRLCLGIDRPGRGFELHWAELKPGEAIAPVDWHCAIERGAGRYGMCEAVLGLAAYADDLYIVAGRTPGPMQRPQFRMVEGFELIRVRSDDSWELMIGEPRVSAHGLEVPLTGLGPGLNGFQPAEFDHITATGSHLYVSARAPEGPILLRSESASSETSGPIQSFEQLDVRGLLEYRSVRLRQAVACRSGTVLRCECTDLRGAVRRKLFLVPTTVEDTRMP